jgi:putative transposase
MPGHSHLNRLKFVWTKQPVYFVTACVERRQRLLATAASTEILESEWRGLRSRYGWAVGQFVIMPDHVHFFVTPESDASVSLSVAVGKWKEWTAKRVLGLTKSAPPFWQAEFFDHLLRSGESRSEKWEYARNNPVRAGLVSEANQWLHAGWIDFE